MAHNAAAVSLTVCHELLCRWDSAQQLTHHATPVLSLCTAPLPSLPCTQSLSSDSQVPQHSAGTAVLSRPDTPNQRLGSRGSAQLVWSGATNGSLAALLVTTGDDVHLHDHQHGQQSQTPQRQLQQQPPPPEESGRQHGRLVWSAEQWHQSGINALHAAPTAGKPSPSSPADPNPLSLAQPPLTSRPHLAPCTSQPRPHPHCHCEYCCTTDCSLHGTSWCELSPCSDATILQSLYASWHHSVAEG